VLATLRSACPEHDIVVVDDGSTDDTSGVARAGGAAVLRLPYNLGIGGALRTGFRYAVEHDYDAAVQVDADGQHDPASIEVLLGELSHADFVIGSRFSGGSVGYRVGRVRRIAMRMLEVTVRLLTGTRYTDTSSGFRAFDRDVIEFFARTYPAEYMESVEALVQATYEGFRIVEVPIGMNARAGGDPSTMHAKLAYHYFRVIVTLLVRARRRPVDRHRPAPAHHHEVATG
jgi:glycosyltransferase involved in cell wall biosynthesis